MIWTGSIEPVNFVWTAGHLWENFMDGWVAWLGALVGIAGGVVAVYTTLRKNMTEIQKRQAEADLETAKTESSRVEYLFSQYRQTVDTVRREHAEDRTLLKSLQDEHTTCREEVATMKAEVAGLRRQVRELQSGKST